MPHRARATSCLSQSLGRSYQTKHIPDVLQALEDDLCLQTVLRVISPAGRLVVNVGDVRLNFQVVLIEVVGHRSGYFGQLIASHVAVWIHPRVPHSQLEGFGDNAVAGLDVVPLGPHLPAGFIPLGLAPQIFAGGIDPLPLEGGVDAPGVYVELFTDDKAVQVPVQPAAGDQSGAIARLGEVDAVRFKGGRGAGNLFGGSWGPFDG